MSEEEMTTLNHAALAIVGIVFDKQELNTGVIQLMVPFTPHKTGKLEVFHVVIYSGKSGWHQPIQEALKDE